MERGMAAVVVAPIVNSEKLTRVEVPMATWSLRLRRVMLVPLSVKPEALTVEVEAPTGNPLETINTWPGVAEIFNLVKLLVLSA